MELMPMIHCIYMIVSTIILGGLTLLDFINAEVD